MKFIARLGLTFITIPKVIRIKYKTNSDIGIPGVRYFDEEVKKYCYMWKDGGQFSTPKYKSKEE